MGFSRQEYWSELPCCPPGKLPDPRIDPASLLYFRQILCTLSYLGSPYCLYTAGDPKAWWLGNKACLLPLTFHVGQQFRSGFILAQDLS